MRRKGGFTLIELLIATAIFVIAISGLLGAFFTSAYLNESARNLTTAVSHASRVLEEMRNTNFSSITSTNWTTWAANNGLNTLTNERVTTSFSGTDPLLATVTVSYSDRNRARTESLVSLITAR